MNLKRTYGHTYQIKTEEGGDKKDPTAWIIPGKYGHIYVHGAHILGVATNNAGRIAKLLAAMPGVFVRQDGSDGINAIFAPSEFEAVADIIQCRKKRKRRPLSPEAKARLLKIGAEHRFQSAGAPSASEGSNSSADTAA
jgi:hypothetical protein